MAFIHKELQMKWAGCTRNEELLPQPHRVVLEKVKEGYNTSRQLAEINPLRRQYKNNRSCGTCYSGILKELVLMGFLQRERDTELPIVESGYGYIYKIVTIDKSMRLDLPENHKLVL